jgi:hypothetical protein
MDNRPANLFHSEKIDRAALISINDKIKYHPNLSLSAKITQNSFKINLGAPFSAKIKIN